MAELAILALTVVSTVMGVASAAATTKAVNVQAENTIAAGVAEQEAAEARKAELDSRAFQSRQAAGQERASAQRAGIEERRKGRLIESRAQAVGAASGAGGTGLELILANLGAESEFRELNELFLGEERARELETSASFRTFEGVQERRAGQVARTAARGTARAQVAGGRAKVIGQIGSTVGNLGVGLSRYAASRSTGTQ